MPQAAADLTKNMAVFFFDCHISLRLNRIAVADFHVGGFARHKHKIHIRLADFSALEDSLQVDETRLLDVGGGVGKLLVLDVDGVGMRACWVDVESRVYVIIFTETKKLPSLQKFTRN